MSRKIESGPLKGKTLDKGLYLNNGYLYVRIFDNGRPLKTYIGPETEAGILDKARIELDKLKGLRRAGKLGQELKAERWTVEKACDAYWKEEGSKKPSYKTIRGFVAKIKGMFANEWVDEVNFTHTVALREKLEKDGLKLNSINRYHACWRRIFYFLVEMKRVKAHGFANLKLPEFNPGTPIKSRAETHLGSERHLRRRRVLSPEEFAKFCSVASPRVREVCMLAVHTMLRLKDLKQAVASKNLEGHGLQSKTQREYEVELSDKARELIGRGVDFTNFTAEFRKARKDSGLPHFQFRDLRKSLGAIMRESNYDLKKISELYGHASMSMTEVYLPVNSEEKRKAVNEAAALFDLPQAVGQ